MFSFKSSFQLCLINSAFFTQTLWDIHTETSILHAIQKPPSTLLMANWMVVESIRMRLSRPQWRVRGLTQSHSLNIIVYIPFGDEEFWIASASSSPNSMPARHTSAGKVDAPHPQLPRRPEVDFEDENLRWCQRPAETRYHWLRCLQFPQEHLVFSEGRRQWFCATGRQMTDSQGSIGRVRVGISEEDEWNANETLDPKW